MENVLLVFPDSPGSLVSVRTFRVEERLSGLFEIVVTAVTPDESLDLSGIVGHSAVFTLVWSSVRVWSGVCEEAQFVRVSETGEGLATFEFRIRPTLWRLTQRVQNRLFQHQSIPEIVSSLMSDWKIPYEWHTEAQYPRLELRTQFGETDFAFVSRLLEEAGISYWFRPREEGDMTVVFGDAPQVNEERGLPLPFVDDAAQAQASRAPFLTNVRLREQSRPGKITHREYDPTRARSPIYASAESDRKEELAHEIYRFAPGSHLREDPGAAQAGSDDPLVMDDIGVARFDSAFGAQRARLELEALRSDRRVLTFEASVNDLAPGVVFRIANHPRVDLAVAASFLVTSLVSEGEVARTNTWKFRGAGVSTDRPHRPAMTTSKPKLPGLQTAVVVGPIGQRSGTQRGAGGVGELSNTALDTNATVGSLPDDDVYVDEQGRVRVQFPWDRDHSYSSESSIWMRVSQGWAGGGYGLFTIPRVGHEVLISFVDGDPDCPLIVGRVHNGVQPVPFALPDNKTVSTWKTSSSPGSGGFNELRFDDAAGREHVFVQAEKNMDQLVKNDLKVAVGHDRQAYVQNDEGIGVGNDRTKFVNKNELEATGLNRHQFVGLNHLRTVGAEDSTQVGARWSVTIARGMTSQLVRELDRMAGSLGSVLRAGAGSTLGSIVADPLAKVAEAALTGFGQKAFEKLANTLSVLDGFANEPGPAPTAIEMVDRQIKLTTGEASIVLDGPNVVITAQGTITLHSMGDTAVLSEREVAIAGREKVALVSATSDIVVQAGKDLHLNPSEAAGEMPEAEPLGGDPEGEVMRCGICSSRLELRDDGWTCPNEMHDTESGSGGVVQ